VGRWSLVIVQCQKKKTTAGGTEASKQEGLGTAGGEEILLELEKKKKKSANIGRERLKREKGKKPGCAEGVGRGEGQEEESRDYAEEHKGPGGKKEGDSPNDTKKIYSGRVHGGMFGGKHRGGRYGRTERKRGLERMKQRPEWRARRSERGIGGGGREQARVGLEIEKGEMY